MELLKDLQLTSRLRIGRLFRKVQSNLLAKIIFLISSIATLFYLMPNFSNINLPTKYQGMHLPKSDISISIPKEIKGKDEMEKYIFDLDFKLPPAHPIILRCLREYHIFSPTPSDDHYSLKNDIVLPMETHLASAINKVMGNKKAGFFIERGAKDGKYLSNSIHLDMKREWTGLLIEGSPSRFRKLKSKRRKSWVSDICLSGSHPERIEFLKQKDNRTDSIRNGEINSGRRNDKAAPRIDGNDVSERKYISEGIVDCFPLYSILVALDRITVDFLSLHVEGHEYKILKAVPFHLVDIKVITLLDLLVPEEREAIKSLLMSNGYYIHFESPVTYIFIKG